MFEIKNNLLYLEKHFKKYKNNGDWGLGIGDWGLGGGPTPPKPKPQTPNPKPP